MDLVHVEYEIELAYVLEAFVQGLDEDLYQVQDAQLRLRAVDAEHKVERGIVPVDELVVGPADQAAALQEVAHVVIPLRNELKRLFYYLLLHILVLKQKMRLVWQQSVYFSTSYRGGYLDTELMLRVASSLIKGKKE